MKKLGVLVMALAAVAVLGAAVYAAVVPAPKAAPVKKVEAKLMTAKGTITAVDVKTESFSLKEANVAVEMTFKGPRKLIETLKVGENVVVGYTKRANGVNGAVYVTEVKKEAVKK